LPCATWRPSGERSAAHAKATALRAPPLPIAEHGWFITLADVHSGDTTGRICKHNRGGFPGKDKPLYLDGFTKGEVIRHYSHIAPVLLRHLKGRPSPRSVSRTRVGGRPFFEKNVPRGAPDWLRTVPLLGGGSRGPGETIEYALFEELPAMV
jgi:hypothetical protein